MEQLSEQEAVMVGGLMAVPSPLDTFPALPDDGIEAPSIGPQEFIPHDDELAQCTAPAECLPLHMRPEAALATARQLLDATVAELLTSKLRVEHERDTLAGQVEELSRERDALLKENARLRSQAETLPATEEEPAGGAGMTASQAEEWLKGDPYRNTVVDSSGCVWAYSGATGRFNCGLRNLHGVQGANYLPSGYAPYRRMVPEGK